MSLKTDFYDGTTGIHAKCNDAFAAGVAFVGSGVTQISSLDLGDRSGSNMGTGSGVAGIYVDIDGPSAGYRVWISVAGEIAPASAGRQLVQVAIASSATRAQAAASISAALSAISGAPFSVQMIGDSLSIETSAPKTIANPISLSANWGSAVVTTSQVGSDPVGNFATIRAAILSAAAAGLTNFCVSIMATYNPSVLRGPAGNCKPCGNSCSSPCGASGHNGNSNLILKSYLAGIECGLADQQIYNYECDVKLNVSDTIDTKIDLIFHF